MLANRTPTRGLPAEPSQMDQQERNGRGRHSGNAHGLTQRLGTQFAELLLDFDREARHGADSRASSGSFCVFMLREARNLVVLALDVAVIFGLDFDLFGH